MFHDQNYGQQLPRERIEYLQAEYRRADARQAARSRHAAPVANSRPGSASGISPTSASGPLIVSGRPDRISPSSLPRLTRALLSLRAPASGLSAQR
jgi:hypothetical protein